LEVAVYCLIMSPLLFEKSSPARSVLWYTRCPVPTAFSLAWELGALEREFRTCGIAWKSLQETGDPQVIQSHFSHTQEDSFRQGGNIPALWAKSRGAETRLIGLSWVQTPYPILTVPESGILSVSDLKGKRLLVLRHSRERAVDFGRATTLRTYEVALESAGLGLEDVKLIEVEVDRLYVDAHKPARTLQNTFSRRGGYKEAIVSLIRREVDAIALQLASGFEIAALIGASMIVDVRALPVAKAARTNNGAPRTLTVSARLADEQPEMVARVVAHLLEAAEWAQSHPREVVRIVARDEHVAEEIIDATYGPGLGHTFGTDLLPENVLALRSQADFLLRHGFLVEDIDFAQWIDPRPLERAREILAERSAVIAKAEAKP